MQLKIRILLVFLLFQLKAPSAQGEETPPLQNPMGSVEADFKLQIHEWDRAVRGFRREHNFALLVGSAQEQWNLRAFGEAPENQSIPRTSYTSRFQYTFHIPMSGSVGYFLGSGIGTRIGRKKDANDRLQRPTSLVLPGIIAGMAYNPTPVLRLTIGVDAYLERLDNIGFESAFADPAVKVSATGRVVSYHVAMELFFRLNWAIKLFWEQDVLRLKTAGDVDVSRTTRQLGAGLVYHLL